ncbi:MAG: phosphopantothenoylcysteine decarboxylase [Phycisphaerae bacterium]|jgi:phosphopantothenoylcysteine decarboxylase/phosphopantothenate--cysteine ligase
MTTKIDQSPHAEDPPGGAAGGATRDLDGYEVAIGVGGGIAAYKVCTVVSRLVQRGCGVSVAMTAAGARFVGPITFQALTARQVFTTLWETPGYYDPQHLRLTESADLYLVAPATADLIGKFAAGIADDLVTTLMIGRDCPAVLAPAMNTRMWENPVVQRNLAVLRELGFVFIEPEEGWLACRDIGRGRMAEPQTILAAVEKSLKSRPPRTR